MEPLRKRIQPYLDRLRLREITNRDVADALGCNEQHLSRLLSQLGFEKEPAVDRAAHRELVKARKDHLAHCAATMTPEDAARACDVSVRTIYRHLKKLGK